MTNSELFIENLLHITPELKEAYNEHLVDNDILLPHVFMGDVTRFVLSRANNASGLLVIQRILDYIEKELLTGDEDSKNIIRASFIENLIGENTTTNKLKPMMGPGLLSEIEAICGI